jgi:MFS transporter, PHS family, inorganic phosphate transporter
MGNIPVIGLGFAADAYDLFVVNLALKFMEVTHELSTDSIAGITAIALVGSTIGQITFGYLAKKMGRTKVALLTLIFIALGSFGCSILTAIPGGFIGHLIFWRFVLGFGIGGEYPLSSTLTWEKSTGNKIRDAGLVFSMQGIGSLIAPIVVLILLGMTNDTETIWRCSLGFGLVFCALLVYPRLMMHETTEFKDFKNNNNLDLTPGDKRRKWMLGTAGSWLIFDIAFYANGLFNSTVTSVLHLGDSLEQQTYNTLFLASIALPGYYFGVWLVQKLDMYIIQFYGFIALGVLYLILGMFGDNAEDYPALFIIIYGLTFFVSNAGPNMTTYILPVKTFHVSVRPFYHGISAASGKIGAIIGASMLKPMLDAYGISAVLYICALLSFAGGLWSKKFVPTDIELSQNNVEIEMRNIPPQLQLSKETVQEEPVVETNNQVPDEGDHSDLTVEVESTDGDARLIEVNDSEITREVWQDDVKGEEIQQHA